jgi:two-component system NarL family sensor kinase
LRWGGLLALLYLAAFPAPLIVVITALGLLGALFLRAYLGRRLEYALTADLRAHVTADVAEEERSRLACELHDVPLQQLSGVIRRLELVPEAKSETGTLLAIADELRDVAIELHPPMLDDLGVSAALDFLAERSSTGSLLVEAQIKDLTAPYRRPPSAVESAVFRIAYEAVNNAIEHAQASHVRITAMVSMHSIDLEIADDGKGISDDDMRRASSRGHFGVSSMRRRAQAIDADLAIEGSPQGTKVKVTWRG